MSASSSGSYRRRGKDEAAAQPIRRLAILELGEEVRDLPVAELLRLLAARAEAEGWQENRDRYVP